MESKQPKSGNEDILDHLLYPALSQIAKVIPKKITPNQITVLGCLTAITASLTLLFAAGPTGLILTALLLILYSILDSLDGIHARNTSQTSKFGAFLDLFLDQISQSVIYFSLFVHFGLTSPFFIFCLIMRINIATFIFLRAYYLKIFKLARFGQTFEIYLISFILLLTAIFPWSYEVISPTPLLQLFDFQTIDYIKLMVSFGLILIIVQCFEIFLDTSKELKKEDSAVKS